MSLASRLILSCCVVLCGQFVTVTVVVVVIVVVDERNHDVLYRVVSCHDMT